MFVDTPDFKKYLKDFRNIRRQSKHFNNDKKIILNTKRFKT